jgi:hypothetical protein
MAQTITPPKSTTPPRLLDRLLGAFFHYLRLIIGCIFIVIGILGVILPVLPGTIWLIIASLIIGKRSRILRRASVAGKRWLRRWAALEQPIIRGLGRWSLGMQQDTSRSLRRINRWMADRQNALRRRLLRA